MAAAFSHISDVWKRRLGHDGFLRSIRDMSAGEKIPS